MLRQEVGNQELQPQSCHWCEVRWKIRTKTRLCFQQGQTESEVEGKTRQQAPKTPGTTHCCFSCTHSTRSWSPVLPLPHYGILGKHPLLSSSPPLCKQEMGTVLRHNAEEATELSAALEAAWFWNAAAKMALSVMGCKTDHPPAVFLYTKDWSMSLHTPNSIREAKDCPFHQTCMELAGLP